MLLCPGVWGHNRTSKTGVTRLLDSAVLRAMMSKLRVDIGAPRKEPIDAMAAAAVEHH